MFIFLIIMNSLIPIMMIAFGVLWKNHPPISVNWVYGYRTSMFMKNEGTWKFAHFYHSKVWFWCGIVCEKDLTKMVNLEIDIQI